jgi:hypothetical protein
MRSPWALRRGVASEDKAQGVGRASDVILCMAIAETREEAMAFLKHLLKLVG